MSYIPHHYCKPPSNISYNASYITKDQCTINSYPYNRSKGRIPCPNGWTYETLRGEIYPSNEFDLVCEREYLFRLALTVPYIGVMLGSVVFGYLSDKYGRRTTTVLALPLLTVVTTACAYVPDLTTFMLVRFLAGFFSQGAQTSATTYASELFRRKTRTIISYTCAFIAAVCLPLQMYLMFLPESVPWLISKYKLKQSKETLEKFAKFNKLPVSETLEDDLQEQAQEFVYRQSKSSLKNFKILLCHPSLTRITLSITYMMWVLDRLNESSCSRTLYLYRLVNNLVIGGLSFSISALEGNVYTNYLVNGLAVSKFSVSYSALVACYALLDIF
uniref:Major facilitator superfamily (MFS) profile domain-containing protein n=1 Tax=Strigamia maritima TaxID=126957 RepID=T1JPK9_STRMM